MVVPRCFIRMEYLSFGTTIAMCRQMETEKTDSTSQWWQDDDDSDGSEDFLPGRSINSGGEEEHVLNPEMAVSLCFSPLKFESRKGVPCNYSDSDANLKMSLPLFKIKMSKHRRIHWEGCAKMQWCNEDSPPSPWVNKCKEMEETWSSLVYINGSWANSSKMGIGLPMEKI